MASAMRRLAGQSLIYAVAGMAASLASFALTPLYARFLGPADFGRLDALMALIQIVTILTACGFSSASVVMIVQPKGELPATATTALSLTAVMGLLWLTLGTVLAPWLAGVIGLPADSVRLVVVAGVLGALIQIPFAVWRGRGHAWTLAGMTIVQVLMTLGANLYLVAWRGQGVDGILSGLIGVQCLVALAALRLVRREWRHKAQPATAKQMAVIGFTHVTNSLSTWMIMLSDRFFLAAMVSATELGYYSLGNKVAAVVQLSIASPLALAWPGFLAQMGRQAGVMPKFGRLFEGLCAYAAGLFLFLSLPAATWCVLIGGERFAAAADFVTPLAAGALIAALQPVLLSGFGLSMRVRTYPLVSLSAALTNVGLNLLLIPRIGAWGAAWSTLAAFTVAAVVGRTMSERLWRLPVPWRRITGNLSWTGALWLIGRLSPSVSWQLTMVAVYPLGALLIGGWSLRDLRRTPVPVAPTPDVAEPADVVHGRRLG